MIILAYVLGIYSLCQNHVLKILQVFLVQHNQDKHMLSLTYQVGTVNGWMKMTPYIWSDLYFLKDEAGNHNYSFWHGGEPVLIAYHSKREMISMNVKDHCAQELHLSEDV